MTSQQTSTQTRPLPHRIAVLVLLILFATLLLAWMLLRHYAEPIARHRIVEDLEARLHCKVELDQVHLSLLHGLEVNGSGLRIASIGNQARITPGGVPMLSVRTFQFATTPLALLLHHSSAITAYAQGLVLTIPPRSDREHLQQGDPSRKNQPRDSTFLNKLVVTDSRLTLETSDPAKRPVEFDFNKLILVDPGKDLPFVFEAILTNPKPIGEVHTTGHIGPWVFADSRQTPIDGNYTFEQADLASIPGLAGTLASSGHIAGPLGQMAVHGTTDTPDFALDISAHPFPVHTEYQALINGTNGDVALQAVAAHFLHSAVTANGLVTRAKNRPGHTVALDIQMHDGRAEDLLTLFSKAPRPLLSAAMSLHGHLDVPPGKQRLVLKLHSRGSASLAGAVWSSPALQEKVDSLSMRAEDRAKEAKANPEANPRVRSSMTGRFFIRNGGIDIPKLIYQMPGATVLMKGRYPLVDRDLDFHGVARTVATASEMETGIKSLLLRPISPFLKKRGAGMQIPVSFTGDKAHPGFSLDLRHSKSDAELAKDAPTIKPTKAGQ